MRRVVHRQHDAGDELDRQHEGEDAAEGPPKVQIAWRRIGNEGRVDEAHDRQSSLEPFQNRALRLVGRWSAHVETLQIWKTAISRCGFWCRKRIHKAAKANWPAPAPAGCAPTYHIASRGRDRKSR